MSENLKKLFWQFYNVLKSKNQSLDSDVLIKKVCNTLKAFFIKHVQDENEANELVQEVFYETLRSIKNFREECCFYTFVYIIAKRRLFNFYRKHSSDLTINNMEDISKYNEKLSSSRNPHDILEAKQFYCSLKEKMETLSPREKIAIKAHLEGMKNTEIAQILNTTDGNIRVMLSRIKGSLKSSWEFLLEII